MQELASVSERNLAPILTLLVASWRGPTVTIKNKECPYCGEEMQLGCIQCRDGVYWSEKERVIAALNIGGGKSIKLNEKSIGGPFGGASAEAWLCEKCKKIVIEY